MVVFRKIFFVSILLLSAIGSVRADYDTGLKAYMKGDLKTAYREWLPLAQAGNAKAQLDLGYVLLSLEDGMRFNTMAGLAWFGDAARQGNLQAIYELGHYLLIFKKLPDYEKLAECPFRRAAERGHQSSRWELYFLLKKSNRMAEAEIWHTRILMNVIPRAIHGYGLGFVRLSQGSKMITQSEKYAYIIVAANLGWGESIEYLDKIKATLTEHEKIDLDAAEKIAKKWEAAMKNPPPPAKIRPIGPDCLPDGYLRDFLSKMR